MIERRTNQLGGLPEGEIEHRDPSANVLLLVNNATEYLKVLHDQSDEFYNKKLEQSQAFLDQKLQIAVETSRREAQMESKRIDALREVDKKAVDVANERAIRQADLLAAQMTKNNEAFREALADQAKTTTSMVEQITASLDARLKIVERCQDTSTGTFKGYGNLVGWIFGGVSFVLLILKFYFDYMV